MPEVHGEAWGSHIAAVGLSHSPRICAHSSKAGQVYGKLLQRRTVSRLLAADATILVVLQASELHTAFTRNRYILETCCKGSKQDLTS